MPGDSVISAIKSTRTCFEGWYWSRVVHFPQNTFCSAHQSLHMYLNTVNHLGGVGVYYARKVPRCTNIGAYRGLAP